MKKLHSSSILITSVIWLIFLGTTFINVGSLDHPFTSNDKINTENIHHKIYSQHFDKNNIVLKFGVLADIHIQGNNRPPSKKFASALKQLLTKANGNLDALLIAGDLTDYGLPSQVSDLKRIMYNSGLNLTKTRFIFALGNHEYYNHQLKGALWKGGYLFRDIFGNKVYKGATRKEIKAGDYHTTVNGYDFIAVNCSQYEGGVKYLSSDINWLKKQLKIAASNHPGKPVFVVSHPMITGTNFGSNEGAYWAGKDLYNVFMNYPQVIYFCGHLHFPENDERSIWQGDFTTIGVGSTFYCSNHPKDDKNGNTFIDIKRGFETDDARETSQGLFVEVDKQSNVKIVRMDFANEEEIKSPWIIPAPQKDKSQLSYYTLQQEIKNLAGISPYFPHDASVKIIYKNNDEFKIMFTQAKDNDMVYSYRISFVGVNTNKILKTISTLSDFYLHAKPEEMASYLTRTIKNADSVLSPFGINYANDYYLNIVAIDCFGKTSKPLISKIINNSTFKNEEKQKSGYSSDFRKNE